MQWWLATILRDGRILYCAWRANCCSVIISAHRFVHFRAKIPRVAIHFTYKPCCFLVPRKREVLLSLLYEHAPIAVFWNLISNKIEGSGEILRKGYLGRDESAKVNVACRLREDWEVNCPDTSHSLIKSLKARDQFIAVTLLKSFAERCPNDGMSRWGTDTKNIQHCCF